MRRALLVISLLVACNEKERPQASERPAPVAEVAAGPVIPEVPVDAALDTVALELPEVVGLPVFLSSFTANAKLVDLSEPISRLSVDETTRTNDDVIQARSDVG